MNKSILACRIINRIREFINRKVLRPAMVTRLRQQKATGRRLATLTDYFSLSIV
jgi:hypothetical protein